MLLNTRNFSAQYIKYACYYGIRGRRCEDLMREFPELRYMEKVYLDYVSVVRKVVGHT